MNSQMKALCEQLLKQVRNLFLHHGLFAGGVDVVSLLGKGARDTRNLQRRNVVRGHEELDHKLTCSGEAFASRSQLRRITVSKASSSQPDRGGFKCAACLCAQL